MGYEKCSITRKTILESLEKKYFINYYQPIYDAKSNQLNGVEVLLRLIHPSWGVVYPNDFIGLAEKEGLIDELFFFSTSCAIRDLKTYHQLKKISINVSPSTLNVPNIHHWLIDKCKESQILSHQITLELTENIEYRQNTVSLENIKRLRGLGFGLSIDDFGAGYSSLPRLMEIPFTELKIDKILIQNIFFNNKNKKIMEHLVSLVHSLGAQIVAEGIEDRDTYNMMKEIGVDLCQGYFFHRPMSVDDFVNNMMPL
ncbi:EAL domain-containing protein [uncultured Photobacterium sp.]|uniref:EAL domain-containing protein n=1 Tax=uncultured Photobacterium sp. TaxID=173973 RepID=UPI002610CCAB|nr:EAL domain-containing protein [uncultured Photobacterium sp.]